MKISDKMYILILFIVILILSLTSYWRFKDFSQRLTKVSLPEIEIKKTNLDDFLPPKKEGYQEWISPDNKLKLQCPADWMGTTEMFQGYFDQPTISLPESEVLFFAHQIDIEKQTIVALTVSEINIENNLEEIIEKIKQDAKEQGRKNEVVSINDEKGDIWLEITSEYPNQPNFFSKGKLLFTENKTYLITFTAPQKDWPKFKEEAKKIFDSIQLL